MKKIYTLLFGLSLVLTVHSQGVIDWQRTIGGNSLDELQVLQQTLDGGYILGGYSQSNVSGDKTENTYGWSDYWVVKTDAMGIIQWQNNIGGESYDNLYSIQQTIDGGYILGGSSASGIFGDKTEINKGFYDFWIVKITSNGNIQWQKSIGGSGEDVLRKIIQTSDGGYILGGWSNSDISGDKTENNKGLMDYWVVKINSIGSIQWQKTIGGSENDYLYSLENTTNGGIILGGASTSGISGDKTEVNRGDYDYWFLNLDSIGNIIWQKTFGGSNKDWLKSIQQTSDGGYILGGYSDSNITGDKTEISRGDFDYWIIKIDSIGDIQWQRTIGGNSTDQLFSISQTLDNGFILGGSSYSNISGEKTENKHGQSDYWILKLNNFGSIQWQKNIGGNGEDRLCSIREINDGDYLIGGYSYSNISGEKTEDCKGWNDFWIVKLTSDFNLISGNLFIDLNNNSVQDFGEHSLNNLSVSEINTGRFSLTDIDGYYNLNVVDTGNFSVSPSPLLHYTAIPASHSAYFSAMNQTDSLNNFAFQSNGVINDLQVTINPIGAFRPGFNAHYNIHYKNVGTTSIAGDIIFKPDSVLSYISSPTTPTSITADSVVWNITTLNPFDEGNILVTVNVITGAVLGSAVNSIARIEPVAGDAIPADNESTWPVTVTGSYDPNDILVNREIVSTAELISPPFLDYLIRFQNTGTDTAFTVKIRNPLPVNAQLNTFEFLESSHPVQLNYSNPEQLMWFQFDNILLPDSNTNELLSHGYVRYRIKPQSTLVVGDLLESSASIFFDFNAPIYTNTAVTEIVLPSSVPGIKNNFDFSIFPNPSTGEVNISFNLKEEMQIKIELYNSLGQIVKTITQQKFTSGKNQINFTTENLSKGIYHIKFSVGDDVVTRKLVKM